MLSVYLTSKAGRALERGALVARSLLAPRLEVVSGYSEPVARAFAAEILGICERSFEDLLASVLATREQSEPDFASGAINLARRSELYGALRRELEDWEAVSLVALVATASTETVERLIARCVLVLLRDEALRTGLVERPGGLVPFIEEVLRLFPPEPTLVREARQDVVLGGHEIPRGDSVSVSVAAANRDPAFYQNSQRIRLDRSERQHFSFGAGVHQCIGAGLARRLCFSALDTLLKEAPGFRSYGPISEAAIADVGGRLLPKELWINLPDLRSPQAS
jgi:cytochrome P450